MTCDQTQPLLDAFADCELGWGTAWRVRRHLAACPACVAELAETRRLDSRVRAWRDVPAPAALQSRIAAALPLMSPVSVPQRPVTARRIAVGLAGVAAATAAFFWLTPGQPGRPTIAFADVERAMQQVQMVSYDYHCETQIHDAKGHIIPNSLPAFQQVWIRRTPPAISEYDPILHTIHLEDTRGLLTYDKIRREYRKSPFHDDRAYALKYDTKLNKYVKVPFHATIQLRINEDMGFVTETPANSNFANWKQQKVERDGIACQEFTQADPLNSAGVRTSIQTSIWVDLKTLRVIRLESEGESGKRSRSRLVLDNIHYNETPPAGVFDWSPPPGSKVRGHW